MCGLVGLFSSYITPTDVEKFEFLLLLSSTRGKHSTGVLSAIRDGNYNQPKEFSYHYIKTPKNPLTFTSLPEWKALSSFKGTKGFMGHTRFATVGSINSANAHPFESEDGNVIGMHNGTLSGAFDYKEKYQTDSEALINILSKKGVKGLSSLNGAFAIVWMDCAKNTINIIRNNDRPLFYMVTGANDFVYASEKWMLDSFKSKYTLTGEIKFLPSYQLLTINMLEENFISSLKVIKIKGLEAPKVSYSNAGFFQKGWTQGNYRGYGGLDEDWDSKQLQYSYEEWKSPPAAIPLGQPKTNLVEESVKARKETRKEAKAAIGHNSVRSSVLSIISSKLAKKDSSNDPSIPQRFLKGLPELQRQSPDGSIEVQTTKGNWVPLEMFEDLIDYGSCVWFNTATVFSDQRIWVNKTEWACKEALDDPEFKHFFSDITKDDLTSPQ